MNAQIAGVEYVLGQIQVTSEALANEFPEWSVAKIEEKTGIAERWIAGEGVCASDLAFDAAQKLFDSGVCCAGDIDFILLCTQSPDHFLPTTACILQNRLGVPTSAGALDFNLGCSGYVYGLGLASALVASGQAKNVLFLTAELYSRYIHRGDRSVRTLFSDGASATLVRLAGCGQPGGRLTGPFIYGTDGRGADNLIVPAGGMRIPAPIANREGEKTLAHLTMNGPEIFSFTLSAVPKLVRKVLEQSNHSPEDIDLYIFHQANQHMLEHLRSRLSIPREKFVVCLREFGNTVSSSIAIALSELWREKKISAGSKLMLVGFGVGYSWGATLLEWE